MEMQDINNKISVPLREKERLDYVNDDLSLIQKTDGLTFGTDALLLAGFMRGGGGTGAELGGGSGIISMLLATRRKLTSIVCAEVQEEYCELTERNLRLNGLTDKISAVCRDVRDPASVGRRGGFDAVFTNPPYMKTDSGERNVSDSKYAARHEVHGDIGDFVKCAAYLLKYGGSFCSVYRPDRLADLLYAMRASGIEPKRMTTVLPDACSSPSMILTEGRAGGKCGLYLTRPLIIYAAGSRTEYSDDMKYIMDTGSFPGDFYIKK